MEADVELKKWKDEFAKAKTAEEKDEHKKRFKAFLASLSPSERKEFGKAYMNGARQAVEEAKKLKDIANRKAMLGDVLDAISVSYIAEHYFGKSRQWLYQRINGNIVNGKPADFTPGELETLSSALSELGERLKHVSSNVV